MTDLGSTSLNHLQIDHELAKIVRDLDRCPHGRHEGDVCAGWRGPGDYEGGCRGGVSLGNLLMQTETIVGYSIYGEPYVMPPRGERHLPEAWKQARL
jgi:hypothetical protein